LSESEEEDFAALFLPLLDQDLLCFASTGTVPLRAREAKIEDK
jgi:hypothetical protein